MEICSQIIQSRGSLHEEKERESSYDRKVRKISLLLEKRRDIWVYLYWVEKLLKEWEEMRSRIREGLYCSEILVTDTPVELDRQKEINSLTQIIKLKEKVQCWPSKPKTSNVYAVNIVLLPLSKLISASFWQFYYPLTAGWFSSHTHKY